MQKVNITCSWKERPWVSLFLWVSFILPSLLYMDKVAGIHFIHTRANERHTSPFLSGLISTVFYPLMCLRCLSNLLQTYYNPVFHQLALRWQSASSLHHHLPPSGAAHFFCHWNWMSFQVLHTHTHTPLWAYISVKCWQMPLTIVIVSYYNHIQCWAYIEPWVRRREDKDAQHFKTGRSKEKKKGSQKRWPCPGIMWRGDSLF